MIIQFYRGPKTDSTEVEGFKSYVPTRMEYTLVLRLDQNQKISLQHPIQTN